MANTIDISPELTRKVSCAQLYPQIESLLGSETNLTANLSNFCAALKQTLEIFWVGFYLVEGNELVLGPFQGNVACTRIGFGKGVCGAAWKEKQTYIIPNVEAFEGHIACSSQTRSEIVIPIMKKESVVAVLDVDSN
ncbi:MAG: GAF domain-containing protein, partial [Flavobacteriales bacterium]|nr:GAF domain-containing protein [Flavobacteriales bacterium]